MNGAQNVRSSLGLRTLNKLPRHGPRPHRGDTNIELYYKLSSLFRMFRHSPAPALNAPDVIIFPGRKRSRLSKREAESTIHYTRIGLTVRVGK